MTFHLNAATKHSENPVLLPGEPHEWDSLQVSWPGTVLYSARDRKFRCWYSGLDVVQSPGRHWLPGYAESGDGVHWVKPKLGAAGNQLKPAWIDWPANVPEPPWGTYILSLVFENPLPDAPAEKRFGSYWWEPSRPDRPRRKTLAWSPDGLVWTRECTAYEHNRKSEFHDICQLLYDPVEGVRAYSQVQLPRRYDGRPQVRHIGLLRGRDFNRLTPEPEPVLSPAEGLDEEIHFASVKKIGRTYLMLYESDRFSRNPIHGDLRLAVSADGRNFRRVHPHTPLLRTGPKGSWDENLLVTSTDTIQEVGDEFYIFFFGCPNTYNSFPIQYAVSPERRGSWFAPSYLGLATLPRDRFAYAMGEGTLTTHPVDLGADGLWLNADGDHLSVTALDESGKPKARGKLTTERRQTVYRKVVWHDAEPKGTCRLEIALTDWAKLFGIQC